MKWTILATAAALALVPSLAAAEPTLPMTAVPVPIRSYRLLAMSMDDEGYLWTGAIHQVIHRYDPRTGKIENFPLPYNATASDCLCAGDKVYVLGQAYPKLIIYNRKSRQFREVDYPSPKPDVWYGTELVAGRYMYLFDRGVAGLIQWDTQTDTGKAFPYPYSTPVPMGGTYVADDDAIWCKVWDTAHSAQYAPLGIARFDLKTNRFTGYWPFPKDDTGLKTFVSPETTLFLPLTLQGRIRPFDLRQKRWCESIAVPGFGQRFAFLGGPWIHQGRLYFSMSTYDGDSLGCDGKPYHFCNSILQFDPRARAFDFLTLNVDDHSYYQISYMLSAGGQFYATGSNIREPDGTLNATRQGEVVFWQSHKPQPPAPKAIDQVLQPTPPQLMLEYFRQLASALPPNRPLPATLDAWQTRRSELRSQLWKSLGEFPLENRPPVEAKITGRIDHGDHWVEKVVYESMPGLYVTALAYVPKRVQGPAPVVLCLNGHWPQSKATPHIQRRCMSLARMGVIAFCPDVIGTGERARDNVAPPQWYHGNYRGAAPWLVNRSLLGYILFEAMRAVDYLASRPDVDPRRILCTGASGGGKQSMFLPAIDDRLAGSVPVCYLSNYQVHMGANACVGEIPFGVLRYTNQWELLALHAPRPLLGISASRDVEVFQPRHLFDSLEKAKRIYALYGMASQVHGEVVDSGHDYNQPMRELLYNHVARTLLGIPDPHITEPAELPVESEEALRCGLPPQSESVRSLTYRRACELVRVLPSPASATDWQSQKRSLLGRLREEVLGGLPDPAQGERSRVRQFDSGNLHVEHWIFKPEPGLIVPAVLCAANEAPANRKRPAIVLADEHGKRSAFERGLVQRLADAGWIVLAVDPRGLGETAGTVPEYSGSHDYNLSNYSLFCGRPMVGMWATDLRAAVDFLAARPDVDPARIACMGRGITGLAALLAAAYDERISRVISEEMLTSWVYDQEFRDIGLCYFLPRVLTIGDIPQLAACVAPRPLLVLNPVDGQRRPARISDDGGKADFTATIYKNYEQRTRYRATRLPPDRVADTLVEFLR